MDPAIQAKLDALAAENQAMKADGAHTIDALTQENSTLPSHAEVARPSAATPLVLPHGKVVLPQGDAVAARARLKALTSPQLPKLARTPIPGNPDANGPAADDPAERFVTLPRQELPR